MSQTHYFTRDVPMEDVTGNRPTGGASMARFYAHQVKDIAKSEALGRPAYRTIDCVTIIIPGDNGNIVNRRVKPSDMERWPKQWEAYRKQQDYVPDGTLLDNWPRLSRGQVEDLKYNNIFTVEQLSEVPDNLLDRLGMGARRMREHAKAYIEAAATGVPSARLVEENDRMKAQVQLLTSQLGELTRKLEIYMSKAGESVGSVDDPLDMAKMSGDDVSRQKEAAKKAAIAAQDAIVIPEDFESLPLQQLRKICAEITDEKVLSKAHAIDVIQEYKERYE